jgi:MFS superfamily sulfate permease-like transporter
MSEDPSFYDDRHCNLLKEFIESMKEKNVIRFRTAVTRFKDTNDIDKWCVDMFTKIMNKIEKETNLNDIDDYK